MKKYYPEPIFSKRHGIGQYACCSTVNDGEILIGVNDWYSLYSKDRGDSWVQLDSHKDKGIRHFIKLKDGTFFGMGYDNQIIGKFDPKQKKIPFIAKVMRAGSMGDLLNCTFEASFVPVEIPDLAIGYGDSGGYHGGLIDHGIIQLPNGDIIAAMYGQFKQDNRQVTYFKDYTFYQYRTWCIISRDGGKSFEYLSTIADCQTYPISIEAEGYCEADLLDLGDGHLLSVMRTCGHMVYSPMYAAHSYDNGRHWEAPIKIANSGVLPKVIKLTNGALVCSAGSDGTFLIFSGDNGYTWSEPFYISENDGKWDRGPSGYTSLIETNPNELLIVYDDTEDRVSHFENPYDRRIVYINKYKIIERI